MFFDLLHFHCGIRDICVYLYSNHLNINISKCLRYLTSKNKDYLAHGFRGPSP